MGTTRSLIFFKKITLFVPSNKFFTDKSCLVKKIGSAFLFCKITNPGCVLFYKLLTVKEFGQYPAEPYCPYCPISFPDLESVCLLVSTKIRSSGIINFQTPTDFRLMRALVYNMASSMWMMRS